MPWKLVCDLRFREVLSSTIIWKITKRNEKIEKIEKYSQKQLELCTNLYVCLCVGDIHAFYCVCKCCLVYVCVKIYTQRDKLEFVYPIGERSCSNVNEWQPTLLHTHTHTHTHAHTHTHTHIYIYIYIYIYQIWFVNIMSNTFKCGKAHLFAYN